jgi:hypothetical protein
VTDAERIDEKVWAAVCIIATRGQRERRRQLYASHAKALAELAERGLNAAEMAGAITMEVRG